MASVWNFPSAFSYATRSYACMYGNNNFELTNWLHMIHYFMVLPKIMAEPTTMILQLALIGFTHGCGSAKGVKSQVTST